MTSNFDLNISNYNKTELEELLELPPNYDESIIEMKETKLRQNIINDNSIPSIMKTKTLKFIENIKNILTINIKTQKLNPLHNLSNGIQTLTKTYQNVYNVDTKLKRSETMDESSSSFIIKQPNTAYGQSNPSEFYPGIINPLNKRILKQHLNIDTRFRENYYTTSSSNFHLDLPTRFTQVVSMQLTALEMPQSFYAISKVYGNNFFILQIPSQLPVLITIPDGNYSYLDLQTYINTFLSVVAIVEYQKINVLIDINTPDGTTDSGSGRTIFGSSDGSVSFSINFLINKEGNEDKQTPLPLKLGWLLGFREGFYENSKTYVSEGIPDLNGPKYTYLVVDDYNNNVSDGFYGAFTSSILNKNILARISLLGTFSTLVQNNLNLITSPRQYFGPVDIQKLQIQLLDEYGRILDLNNMDFSFCLTFQTVYDL